MPPRDYNQTEQSTVWQGKALYWGCTRNTTRGKESQEQAKESKTHLVLLAGDSEKHQPNNHNINEYLVQMYACPCLSLQSLWVVWAMLSWFNGSCSRDVLLLFLLQTFLLGCSLISKGRNAKEIFNLNSFITQTPNVQQPGRDLCSNSKAANGSRSPDPKSDITQRKH